MSYEGYSQLLCPKGHYWTLDCNDIEDYKEVKCPFCAEYAVWENMVNTTNGSFDGNDNRIDGYIELKIKTKKTGICSNCGRDHICEINYYIPKE